MKYEFLDRQGALDLAAGIFTQVNKRIDERIVGTVDETDQTHVPSSAAVAKAIHDAKATSLTQVEEIVEAAFKATQPNL